MTVVGGILVFCGIIFMLGGGADNWHGNPKAGQKSAILGLILFLVGVGLLGGFQ